MTPRRPRPSTALLTLLLVALVATALVSGVAGGLLRAGALAAVVPGLVLSQAAVGHAFLMVCALLGTVISIERAVAVKLPWCFLVPVASGLAGVLTLAGEPAIGAWLAVLAALGFVGVNAVVIQRQRAGHTLLLGGAALVWLLGNALHASAWLTGAVVPLWLAFLVLTITAERLEMTRLMRRQRGAAGGLAAAVTLLLVGALASGATGAGGVVYGTGLLATALWLARFDIARRTLHARGLSRYMAVCLLAGYGWLALAGVAWVATALGLPARDAALHGLALGFVFSMVFAHAPVILPAVVRLKLTFSRAFYAPLLVLQASLVLRLLLAPFDPLFLRLGATLNAVAIGLFALTVAAAAWAWRRAHALPTPSPDHGHAARH